MVRTQKDSWALILAVLFSTFLGIGLIGSISSGTSDGGMMDGGMMGGMMGFGWLLMILPVLLILFLVSFLFDRRPTPRESSVNYGHCGTETPMQILEQRNAYGTETPMQILERRYACGDISRKDFYKMKEEIYNR